MDRRVFLKVKLKSLAEEARIIKREERKRKLKRLRPKPFSMPGGGAAIGVPAIDRQQERESLARQRARPWRSMALHEIEQLHLHRIRVVRKEARLTLIAYAFIRGRTLASVDRCNSFSHDDWKRVVAMIRKYGGSLDVKEQLLDWVGRSGPTTMPKGLLEAILPSGYPALPMTSDLDRVFAQPTQIPLTKTSTD